MTLSMTRTIVAASIIALTPAIASATCHHCPPEPTIGGVPQPTDDVLMQNGVNWAEASAAGGKAIMEYDGWDPAVRFAQFIQWFAGVMGPNIPTEEDLRAQSQSSSSGADEGLVLAQGKDRIFGEHRIVVPVEKDGFIANGQIAFLETRDKKYPFQVITAASPIKGYGGYLMLAGYAPSGDKVFFGIPSGEKDLEWVYPVVRLMGDKATPRSATLYSEKGRGVIKR